MQVQRRHLTVFLITLFAFMSATAVSHAASPSVTAVLSNSQPAVGEPVQLQAASVTPSLFTVLKARPMLGRLFVDDDVIAGAPGAQHVAILSYGLWQERFGGASPVVGRAVRLGAQPRTVVGVMPKGFAFPDNETRAWIPWGPRRRG